MMQLRTRLPHYAGLMRLDKPIGTLLLLWPTLWALWLASEGHPHTKILFIFIAGVFLMRSAGCVMNDFIDRRVDAHVRRTRERPLASGKVQPIEAMVLALALIFIAFMLVLQCNLLTIGLSLIGAALTIIYPFMKRVTNLPQLGLGIAFAWGIPMAFAAQTETIITSAWFLFATCVIWIIIYDTMYAMVDREDDLKIGVKSTAILFSLWDRLVLSLMQTLFILMLTIVGVMFALHSAYYFSVGMAALLCIYQQWLIKDRQAENCFRAFLNNNWIGAVVFLGIVLSYLQ